VAWTSIPLFTDAVFTSSQANLLRGNLLETPTALATLPGQHFVATGVNAMAARRVEKESINATGTTTSTSYVYGLTTGSGTSQGPDFDIVTGQYAQVGLYCYIVNSGSTDFSFMSFEISGANDTAADDNRASASIDYAKFSSVHWMVAQTPGNHTYRARYRVESGTGTFDFRTMWVLPY
jgi:hypothetical protein